MNQTLLKTVKNSVKNWWVYLLTGIFFVIMSIWVMLTPLSSYIGLSVFFSILMFLSGLAELMFVASNSKEIDGWGWYLAAAIIDFLIGLILLIYPSITMTILPLLVAFWIMFKGFAAVGISLDLRNYKANGWGWLLFAGIVAILFAFLIIANPVIGGVSIVYATSLALLCIGIFRIGLALRLRKLHHIVSGK